MFQEEVRGSESLVFCDFVEALVIALGEELIEFSFGDNCRKHLKIIHEFSQFREGYLVFGLGVKMKNPLQRISDSLEHFHAQHDLFIIIIDSRGSK